MSCVSEMSSIKKNGNNTNMNYSLCYSTMYDISSNFQISQFSESNHKSENYQSETFSEIDHNFMYALEKRNGSSTYKLRVKGYIYHQRNKDQYDVITLGCRNYEKQKCKAKIMVKEENGKILIRHLETHSCNGNYKKLDSYMVLKHDDDIIFNKKYQIKAYQ